METNIRNKCKAYTSLEQSKKLAEFLPIESADMYYCYGMDIHTKGWSFDDTPTIIDNSNQIDVHADIPCWSLAALLGAVDFITINLFYIDERGYWVVSATIHNSTKLCTKYESAIAFNPVDACYELIIKLHEQNLL